MVFQLLCLLVSVMLWMVSVYLSKIIGHSVLDSSSVEVFPSIRNVIFGLRYGKPSSALRPKLGCSLSWVLDDIQRFFGEPCLNKHRFVTYVNSIEKSENNLKIPFFLSSDRRSDNVAPEFPKFSDISQK